MTNRTNGAEKHDEFRLFPKDYAALQSAPLFEAATRLAERARIGALKCLYNQHLHSLAPYILKILDSIPETISPYDYSELLPGLTPPHGDISTRDKDRAEQEEMLKAIKKETEDMKEVVSLGECAENVAEVFRDLVWPCRLEIVEWYQERARIIDRVSGQLENCLSLLDLAMQNGFTELEPLWESASHLYQVVYTDAGLYDSKSDLRLYDWEKLCDYDKFKIMVDGVDESNVLERLSGQAVPFMNQRYALSGFSTEGVSGKPVDEDYLNSDLSSESFLVTWLKEVAKGNKLEICAAVITEASQHSYDYWLFKDNVEFVEVGLNCIYSCTRTDKWDLMASMLLKLKSQDIRTEEMMNLSEDVYPGKKFTMTNRSSLAGMLADSRVVMMSPLTLTEEDNTSKCKEVHGILDALERKVWQAERHVEAGRLLLQYQVEKPIKFFVDAKCDEKGVRQLLRLLLLKYARRQPARLDFEWVAMWKDMQKLQANGFPFLDMQFLFLEYFRGLLNAGKFLLASAQLKNICSNAIAIQKAEKVAIQVAREYFYSASSFDSYEIEMSRQCLGILPENRMVLSEKHLIDAVTVKLPALGVYLIPMQVKQIKDPMEIVKMVLSSNELAYLKVDEVLEVAWLLGLCSSDQRAMVEAAIAREAAASGDLELALELCVVLMKKDYGLIWDLSAALARGPSVGVMDLKLRKQLLGFSLSHCDQESIGELLNVWKEFDLLYRCMNLRAILGKALCASEYEAILTSFLEGSSSECDLLMLVKNFGGCGHDGSEREPRFGVDPKHGVLMDIREIVCQILPKVTKKFSFPDDLNWKEFVKARNKFVHFICLELPMLLEIVGSSCMSTERHEDREGNSVGNVACMSREFPKFARECTGVRLQALALILFGLSVNDVLPKDEFICSVAESANGKPCKEDKGIYSCGYLLNLADPYEGVKTIEEILRNTDDYAEACQTLKMASIFCSLQDSGLRLTERQERHTELCIVMRSPGISASSPGGDLEPILRSEFWTSWSGKVMQRLTMTKWALELGTAIPGIDMGRIIGQDEDYIRSSIFTYVESVKTSKESRILQALDLAAFYGIDKWQVILRHVTAIFTSPYWGEDEIKLEITKYWDEISKQPAALIELLREAIYPELNGTNKTRLSFFYSVLSDFYTAMKGMEKDCFNDMPAIHLRTQMEAIPYYKLLAQECLRLSFVEKLDFKHISGLDDLDYYHAQEEIHRVVDGGNIEIIMEMVQNLGQVGSKIHSRNHFPTSSDVCKTYLEKTLMSFIRKVGQHFSDPTSAFEDRILYVHILWKKYESCRKYMKYLQFDYQCTVVDSLLHGGCQIIQSIRDQSHQSLSIQDSTENAMCSMLKFWAMVLLDFHTSLDRTVNEGITQRKCLLQSLTKLINFCCAFEKLIYEGRVGTKAGWEVISNIRVVADWNDQIAHLVKCMVTSGCSLQAVLVINQDMLKNPTEILKPSSLHITLPDHTLETTETVKMHVSDDFESPPDIKLCQDARNETTANDSIIQLVLDVYLSAIDSVLEPMGVQGSKDEITELCAAHQDALFKIISTLTGKHSTDKDAQQGQFQLTEMLSKIRYAVWNRMCDFAENTCNPSYMRVFVLELLEAIVGRKIGMHKSIDNGEESSVVWDGWSMATYSDQKPLMFSKFNSILTALKSTRIISQTWPDVEVTAENVSSIEAAIMFFHFLVSKADLGQHAPLLKLVLEEWTSMFALDKFTKRSESARKVESICDSADVHDGWEECDDWEDFGETLWKIDAATSRNGNDVNLLHTCWKITLQGLALNDCFQEILVTLEKSRLKMCKVLLTEEEAIELVICVGKKCPISAFKVSLLLPYDSSRILGLNYFEKELRSIKLSSGNDIYSEGGKSQGHTAKEIQGYNAFWAERMVDSSLLILLSASNFFSHIANDPNSTITFSVFCAAILLCTQGSPSHSGNMLKEEHQFIQQVVFPSFIGELAQIRQYSIAGAMVLQYMRVHPALCTVNASHYALKTFLEAHISFLKENNFTCSCKEADKPVWKKVGIFQNLPNSIDCIQNGVGGTIASALEIVARDSLST